MLDAFVCYGLAILLSLVMMVPLNMRRRVHDNPPQPVDPPQPVNPPQRDERSLPNTPPASPILHAAGIPLPPSPAFSIITNTTLTSQEVLPNTSNAPPGANPSFPTPSDEIQAILSSINVPDDNSAPPFPQPQLPAGSFPGSALSTNAQLLLEPPRDGHVTGVCGLILILILGATALM